MLWDLVTFAGTSRKHQLMTNDHPKKDSTQCTISYNTHEFRNSPSTHSLDKSVMNINLYGWYKNTKLQAFWTPHTLYNFTCLVQAMLACLPQQQCVHQPTFYTLHYFLVLMAVADHDIFPIDFSFFRFVLYFCVLLGHKLTGRRGIHLRYGWFLSCAHECPSWPTILW